MIRGSIRRYRLVLAVPLLLLAACSPPEHVPIAASPTPMPVPTPEPSPTPLYVPEKRLDTGRLFNGIQFQTSFATHPGGAATDEIASPSSYTLHLDLDVQIPSAVNSLDALTALNPSLPALFPNLDQWLESAKISPLYDRLYRHKINYLQQSLVRLDELMSRHDFYDCETMLELQPPGSEHKILWIQSDMDVDSDGSDSDRVPGVDANSQTFQPITSYKWPKRGEVPNPFAAQRQARIDGLHDGVSRVGRRNKNHGRIGAGLFHRLRHGVEHGQIEVLRSAFAGSDPAHHRGAVGDGLLGVECAFLAREALNNQAGLLIDEYAHYVPIARPV